jgi:hypothetical protein
MDRKSFNKLKFNRTVFASTVNAMLIPKAAWIITSYLIYYSDIKPHHTFHFFMNSYMMELLRYVFIMALSVRGVIKFLKKG